MAGSSDNQPPSRTPTQPPPFVASSARLVVIEGDRIGRRFLLDQDVMLIGRDETAQVRLEDPQLSRRHAEVRRHGQLYVIADLDSSNGTFVNGTPVKGEAPLKLADKLRLGPSVVLLMSLADPIEEQILQRQRLEALGRLGAGIAHDFNNMLAAVLSSIGYVRNNRRDHSLISTESQEALEDANNAAARAAELSQQLLAFTKGEEQIGNRTNVSRVCRDVVRLVKSTFDRTVVVKSRIQPELWVLGGSMALHQVLTNLCLNAHDAMPDGGTLELRAELRRRPGAHAGEEVVIELIDNGHGMSQATYERAFEPFFTTKRAGAGFGLGLATARDIVTNFGGELSCTSAPGKGTTFRLQLPATQPGDTHDVKTLDPWHKQEADKHAPSLRILLVEDERMVRRSACRVLRHAGHLVEEACDGVEGVAKYQQASRRPDVVVLDLDMPRMGGEEALTRIREENPAAVVVMTSGHRHDSHEQHLLSLGASGFVRKPWTGTDLLAAIMMALALLPDSSPTHP